MSEFSYALLPSRFGRFRRFAPFALAALLSACGGGGGGDESGGTGGNTKPATTQTQVVPACTNCAAVSGSQYAGQGVGIWQATNASAQPQDVPVYIQGLKGQSVTLVYTNDTESVAASSSSFSGASDVANLPPVPEIAGAPPSPHELVQEFNLSGYKSLDYQLRGKAASSSTRSLMKSGPAASPNLNDSRTWTHTDQSVHPLTLVAQRDASDGMRFNIWVENGYFGDGKVTAATVGQVLENVTKSGGIYETLLSLGGPLWGPHNYEVWQLPGDRKWVDIVMLDFRVAGNQTAGYFWGLNNYLSSAASMSNESLGVVLDAPTVANLSAKVTVSNVAHELAHMQNYYRRNVAATGLGTYEVWLEEMSAMMVEDVVSERLSPVFNSIQSGRMPTYLSGNYNCPMLNFTSYQSGCESYSVAGTFGAFLMRQHGQAFFKDLLSRPAPSGSFALMDAVLKASSPASSFNQAFRSFAVSTGAMVAPAAAPAGFGYPARQDADLALMALNPQDWAAYRSVPTQLPGRIAQFGSVPLVRPSSGSYYSEVVTVPAGVTLSVVVQ